MRVKNVLRETIEREWLILVTLLSQYNLIKLIEGVLFWSYLQPGMNFILKIKVVA